MKLSEQLKQDHECGDFGNALEGYSERAEKLEYDLDTANSIAGALESNIHKMMDEKLEDIAALNTERELSRKHLETIDDLMKLTKELTARLGEAKKETKRTDYCIIVQQNPFEFEKAIRKRMKDGYKLHGDPYAAGQHTRIHCQAMIK